MNKYLPPSPNRHEASFEVPEHVIRELGGTAGNVSQAAELIGEPETASDETQSRPEISQTTIDWMRDSFYGAFEEWKEAIQFQGKEHWTFQDYPLPTFSELMGNHDFETKVQALCQAKEFLTRFGNTPAGKTPDGKNIGEYLDVLLVPWGFFAREIQDTQNPSLLYTLIELHGASSFDNEVIENLQADNIRYSYGGMLLSPQQYLQSRIMQEGNWGVMLVQTSLEPGLALQDGTSETFLHKSYLQMHAGKKINVAGVDVGKFGIFEKIALSLQGDPLDSQDAIWLPANVFPNDEIPHPNRSHKTTSQKMAARIAGQPIDRRQIRIAIDSGLET